MKNLLLGIIAIFSITTITTITNPALANDPTCSYTSELGQAGEIIITATSSSGASPVIIINDKNGNPYIPDNINSALQKPDGQQTTTYTVDKNYLGPDYASFTLGSIHIIGGGACSPVQGQALLAVGETFDKDGFGDAQAGQNPNCPLGPRSISNQLNDQNIVAGGTLTVNYTPCINNTTGHYQYIEYGISLGGAEANFIEQTCDGQCEITIRVPLSYANSGQANLVIRNKETGQIIVTSPIPIRDAVMGDPCFRTVTASMVAASGGQYNANDIGAYTDNSDNCKEVRERAECDQKRDQGYVFVSAFGNQCVGFMEFVSGLISYALLFASIIAGAMFLFGAFKYTASRGNPAALIEARDTITQATIGVVLIMLSYVIVEVLSSSFSEFGINLMGPFTDMFK